MFSLKPLERTLHEKPRAESIENNKNNIYTIRKMLLQLIKWNQQWKIRQAEDKVVWMLQTAEQKRMRKQMIFFLKGGIDPGVLTC